MSIVYVFLAIIIYAFFYKINKDLLHPVAVMVSIWFFTAAIAALSLGVYQTKWAPMTHLVIILGGVSAFWGGFLGNKSRIKISVVDEPVNDTFCLMTRIIVLLTFSFTLLVFIGHGMNAEFFRGNTGADLKTSTYSNLEDISRVQSYIINLVPFCSLFAFFELVYAKSKKWIYIIGVIVVTIVYCVWIIYSRGSLLYILLGGLFIFNAKRRISFNKLVALGIAGIIALGLIMNFRMFAGSIVFTGVRGVTNPILASTYNYISYGFENLNRIIVDGSRLNGVSNVFQSILKIFGLYNPESIIRAPLGGAAGVFNQITWLAPFYDDLGIIGIMIYPGLISFMLSTAYRKSLSNPHYVLILAFFQKAVFIPFFGNYFITAFSVMAPYFLVVLVVWGSRRLAIHYPHIVLGKR